MCMVGLYHRRGPTIIGHASRRLHGIDPPIKRDEIVHTSAPTGESDSDRPVAPNDKMFSSAYGAWVAKSRPKKESFGRQPPVHETFGLGVSTEDEYAPLSFRVLDDLEERTGIQERPRPPHIDVNPPRRSLTAGGGRPPSDRLLRPPRNRDIVGQ